MAKITNNNYEKNNITSIENYCHFYMSNLDLLDRIQKGSTPEEALRLAYTNPSYKTPYSIQVQNEQFFSELTEFQKIYFIINKVIELSKLAELERENFLANIELVYEHEEFMKQFNMSIESVENIKLKLMLERENQITNLISKISHIISDNNAKIAQIDLVLDRIAQEKTKLSEEIVVLNQIANNLMVNILEKISLPDMVYNGSTENFKDFDALVNSNFTLTTEETTKHLCNYTSLNNNHIPLLTKSDFKEQLSNLAEDKLRDLNKHLAPELQEIVVKQEMASKTMAKFLDRATDSCMKQIEQNPQYRRMNELRVNSMLKQAKIDDLDRQENDARSAQKELIDVNQSLATEVELLIEAKKDVEIPMDPIISDIANQINLSDLAIDESLLKQFELEQNRSTNSFEPHTITSKNNDKRNRINEEIKEDSENNSLNFKR